eukprot:SAG31_NODE_2601_length_5363_cov_2.456173_4_plen_442_part_00
MHAGRAPGQFDVLPRPGESVLHGRASRSAASLLSLSMSTSMNSLGSMRKLTPYGMPKTGQRISLPMDQALQNLSTSLSDANLSSAPGPETWLQSGASNAAFRPWTSPAQEPTTGGRKIASAKQGVRGTKKCSEEQWLEGMLAQQQSDLHRERIARHQLREAGMKDGHISRLYRLLYLHTSSLQDVLLWITDQCTAAQRGATLLKVWQCLVRVVEHLLANKASSQFSSVLQQSNETIAALEESNLLEATRADHLGKQLGMATGRVEALEAHVYNLQEALETSKQEGRAGMLEEQTRAQTVLATAEAMLRKGDEYSMQAYEQLHSERLHSDQQTTKLTVAEHAREQAEKKLARARAVCQEAEEARRQAEADHAKGTSALRRMESELASRAQELAAERDARSEVEKQLEDEKTGRSVLEQQHTELREAMQALEAEYQTVRVTNV